MAFLKKLKYNAISRALKSASPYELINNSQKEAVSIFQKAIVNNEFYQHILSENELNIPPVHNISDFQRHVPVINKEKIYHSNTDTFKRLLEDVTSGGTSLLLSSGTSGKYSFGIVKNKEDRRNAQFLEFLLNYYFQILSKKTLLINCLSQGVKVPPLHAASVQIGARTEALTYLLKNLAPLFDQTIVIGDNFFIKNALEDASSSGVDLTKIRIHLILGGVYLPESLRDYLNSILNKSESEDGLILSSMGISEFGLNLFFGSPETIRLRRMVRENHSLREQLIDPSYPSYLPLFYNYFPSTYFLEEIDQHLVITDLNSKTLLPLIRYDSQDFGKIIPYEKLKKIVAQENLLPAFKSPLVLVYGRNEFMTINNHKIYPQNIQESLFADFKLAGQTTGYFRMTNEGQKLKLEIQLKKKIDPSTALKQQFEESIGKSLPVELNLILYPYQAYPYGMELNYEQKFRYI